MYRSVLLSMPATNNARPLLPSHSSAVQNGSEPINAAELSGPAYTSRSRRASAASASPPYASFSPPWAHSQVDKIPLWHP